ncbi:hypothetical protein CTER_1859 [Ruminiclostridium cellobioparum subsp. termitidis CT1112]|uniref:Uncharacterized protein n=1 Tax=Ruminiclostridium cellobioparum subsp. termitidis CT1112 TaxID=1195236 RepID=S0FUH9_RUMCE|nr:hypothetical protein CTER_1859 [Ruminiclostridium cellobioparum subsp. termitidis CT1112]
MRFSNTEVVYIFVSILTRYIEVSILKIYLQQFSIEINLITIKF